jgi:hypothetical protein
MVRKLGMKGETRSHDEISKHIIGTRNSTYSSRSQNSNNRLGFLEINGLNHCDFESVVSRFDFSILMVLAIAKISQRRIAGFRMTRVDEDPW